MPHHVTQRGNRRQRTFFNEEDYAAYVELMADWCRKEGVEIWGYCLIDDGLKNAVRMGRFVACALC